MKNFARLQIDNTAINCWNCSEGSNPNLKIRMTHFGDENTIVMKINEGYLSNKLKSHIFRYRKFLFNIWDAA